MKLLKKKLWPKYVIIFEQKVSNTPTMYDIISLRGQ